MAKNPAVDFPWQAALCGLINSFLPEGGQLDPYTAEAPEIQKAIDGLEASTQQMLYDSSLGTAAAAAGGATITHQTGVADPRQMRLFLVLGLTICLFAVFLYKGMGGEGGLDSKDLVEIIRMVLQALVSGSVPDGNAS